MQRLESISKHLESSQTAWVQKNFEPYDFKRVGDLKGKTLLISGASRGIGLAIGLRAAKDGANIAIVAKTVTAHPKLEGTIYSAAEQIEKAGGKCLPIQCDLRDDQSVKNAVEQTVQKFGGIDILVNNASALYQSPVEETDTKKFDLGMQVNSRGSFLCSKLCIPYLRKSKNPHILTISPPLDMVNHKVNWFARSGTGYTLSKINMTLLTHGMAEELREDKIACNTLWPRTTISTAAVKNLLGGDSSIDCSRTPEIMGDAAQIILTCDSQTTTDNFFMDDEVLASEGIVDLSKYKINKDVKEHELIPDFMC